MTSLNPTTSGSRRTVLAVIVSYRSAALVRNLLVSLDTERAAEQARGIDLRAVVVDNASGDAEAIAAAIAELGVQGWVDLVVAPRNGGFAYGNNLGFRHGFAAPGKPDFFFLLNPDTEVRPGAIRALVEFLDQHADAGIAGSGLESQEGRWWPYAFRYPSLWSELDNGLRLGLVSRLLRDHIVLRPMEARAEQVDWFPGASMMVRREVVETLGGMDEGYFLYFEETDFCRKVRRGGWSIWYVPQSRVMHLAGQSTGVTGEHEGSRRLPPYWFESRRRYFAKNHGLAYAMATDAVLLVASVVGDAKEKLKGGRGRAGIPGFTRDLFQHSVLRRANRRVAPAEEWCPRLQKR